MKRKSGRDAVLAKTIFEGDRRALSRAITLVESSREQDRVLADKLLQRLLPRTGRSTRIGISGAPGVGKSTFIETFGKLLSAEGHRIAVLAIDPSSTRSGGSILGDKTRMERLARDKNAFIRPSPSGTTLGGVARRTRESLLLVEAAGFDIVLIETVGAGQSDTAVADMTDIFVVLVSPGAGDDLQGIKRGTMEIADVVLVTKADRDFEAAASRTESAYAAALHLMRPKYPSISVVVMSVSALAGKRIDKAWIAMKKIHGAMTKDGFLAALRKEQLRRWFWSEMHAAISETVLSDPSLADRASKLEDAVMKGSVLPPLAARTLISAIPSA